ncbi:hypothetical protein SADUNF_Sadunf18G0034600 [Salix dunnii]|uniref:Uncharacterized protein n=1 Tax=Salix dunnii TaxID=1413687 RepID=A0A835J7J1_9ROSI|nr:hypothetical protein SADUNF_Sadunf18G0034600 [Salix dunnii]
MVTPFMANESFSSSSYSKSKDRGHGGSYSNSKVKKMRGFAYLVFPNRVVSVLPKGLSHVEGEPMEHGIITSVTHGVMSGTPA